MMPRELVTMRLTEQERSLLDKRARKANLTVADYLRMTMVLEAVTAGDLDAVKILGEAVRAKLCQVFSSGILNAPVKA
jgi:hypothetical protein